MTKRILSLMLSCAIIIAAFAGCGSTTSAPAAPSSTASSGSSDTSTAPEAKPYDGPPLKLLMPPWDQDAATNPLFKQIQEMTGFPLEIVYQPQDEEQRAQKVMMEIAAGTPYDVVKLAQADFPLFAANNAVLALDDLLKEYGPNILAGTTNPENWNALTVNGKIMGIPYYKDPPLVNQGLVVRTDILQKHNIPMPTTTVEFQDALAKIHAAEPDLIPYSVAGNVSFQNLQGAFGCANEWTLTDGKLAPTSISEDRKEMLQYLNSLYAKGLLDKEFSATLNTLKQEKWASGKSVFSSFYWWDWKTVEPLLTANPNATYEMVPALTGPKGNKEMKLVGVGTNSNVICIPKTCEDPVAVIQFLNNFSDYETNRFLRIGEEGVHYEKKGDTYEALPAFSKERDTSWWYALASREDIIAKYGNVVLNGEKPEVKVIYDMLQTSYADCAIPDPTVLLPASSVAAKYSKSLNELLDTWSIGFIMGDIPFTDWDKYTAQWLADGGQASIDDFNTIYQSMKK